MNTTMTNNYIIVFVVLIVFLFVLLAEFGQAAVQEVEEGGNVLLVAE